MEAIILAGGEGTRLRRVVNDRPKPIADINGQPFLNYVFDYLISQKCTRFIISVGYKKEMIKSSIGPQYKGVPVTYVDEDEPLGTGGAFVKSLNEIKNDRSFIVMNGDTSFEPNLTALEKTMHSNSADISLALFKADENDRYGHVEVINSRVKFDTQNRKALAGELAYGGISIIRSKAVLNYFKLNLKKFSFEDDFIKNTSSNGAIMTGLVFDNVFVDIGIPEDYFRFCARNIGKKEPKSH